MHSAQQGFLPGSPLNDTTIRAQITEWLGSSPPRPTGSLGVAPQTKRMLEQAKAIAKPLGHSCPRTEHLLLAAVSRKLHSPAAELLTDCGTRPEQLRDQVTRMILQQSPELADRLTNRGLISRIKMRNV